MGSARAVLMVPVIAKAMKMIDLSEGVVIVPCSSFYYLRGKPVLEQYSCGPNEVKGLPGRNRRECSSGEPSDERPGDDGSAVYSRPGGGFLFANEVLPAK